MSDSPPGWLDDYTDWAKLAEHCETLALSPVEQLAARHALEVLGEELGSRFLEEAFTSRHPLVFHVVNTAPWTRKWFASVGAALERTHDLPGYRRVLADLKNPERYSEALARVTRAAMFRRAGFRVSFEATMTFEGKTKAPDISLVDEDTDTSLMVELTTLHHSLRAQEATQAMESIVGPLISAVPSIVFSGQLLRTPSKPHLAEIAHAVRATIAEAQSTDKLQALVVDDVIELAVAPVSRDADLQGWCESRGIGERGFAGPPYFADEIQRLVHRVQREQAQLPADLPNLVMIEVPGILFETGVVAQGLATLQESIHEREHLFALTLETMSSLQAKAEATERGDILTLSIPAFDAFTERRIVIRNRYCRNPVEEATSARLYSAFRSGTAVT